MSVSNRILLGENIRRVRENLKLSRNDVQDITGIHYQYLGEVERGESNPTIDIIIKLASAYNVTVSELIGEVSIYNSKLNSLIKKLKYTANLDIYNLLVAFENLNKSDSDLLIKLITDFKENRFKK